MVKEKLITEKEAVLRIPAADLIQLLLPSFTPAAKSKAKKEGKLLTVGLPASPGAAFGKLAFTADEAVQRTNAGEKVLLVRKETNPEDIDGMHSAAGILTSTGGMTSHAAVVARGWGRCCVAGAGEISIDEKGRKIKVKGKTYSHKDVVSIDGSTGEVMAGEIATQNAQALRRFFEGDGLVGQIRQDVGSHQCRHTGRRQASSRFWGPRNWPMSAPSTCSSKANASWRCGK